MRSDPLWLQEHWILSMSVVIRGFDYSSPRRASSGCPLPHLLFSSLRGGIYLQNQQQFWVPFSDTRGALSRKTFCFLKMALSFYFCSPRHFTTFSNGPLFSLHALRLTKMEKSGISEHQQQCVSRRRKVCLKNVDGEFISINGFYFILT